MASVACDLSYKNIISSFFVKNKLIEQRSERIANGCQLVLDIVPVRNLSEKLQGVVKSKVVSVDMAFISKWRQSKAKSKEEFEQQYEKWIHSNMKLPQSIMSEGCRQRGSTQTKKRFEDLSDRQKNRRVDDLSSCEISQLLLAAVNSAKRSNEKDLHYVLTILHNDREKATAIRGLIEAEKRTNKSKRNKF